VQTADERVLAGGTAFLCDAGMCGPSDSILGRESAAIIRRFTHCLPVSFPIAQGPVHICGALIEIDQNTGRAESIQRVRELAPA